uniref:Cox-i3 protein n=1 Tax=Starmerella bacillaris TaxID=1247836 RepID=Q6ED51_STABA|nr:cox-i3 protein [Starmerella bacillaris]AAR10348.2 cox-i3 protein [Starmerella bacillaris]
MNINLINNYVGPTKGYHWVESWLFSTNCQNMSILYGMFSLFSGLVGLSLSVLMRIELSSPNPQMLMHNGQLWNVLMTAHALFMVFYLVMPMTMGALANYLVPLQMGSNDTAFPRMNNLAFVVLLPSMLFAVLSCLIDEGPGSGWTLYPPLTSLQSHSGSSMDMAMFALHLSGLSSIFGAINLMVTIINMRANGMDYSKLPLFVWSVLMTAVLMMLALPVLAAGLTMLLMDRNFNTSFFVVSGGGDPLLYEHIFWFFGQMWPMMIMMIMIMNYAMCGKDFKKMYTNSPCYMAGYNPYSGNMMRDMLMYPMLVKIMFQDLFMILFNPQVIKNQMNLFSVQNKLKNKSTSETTRVTNNWKKEIWESEKWFNQWLSGLIDGDGCLLISKKGYTSCEITMNMNDIKALKFMQNKMGGNIKLRSGVKALRWRMNNHKGMIDLINRMNGNIRHTTRLKQLYKICDKLNIPVLTPNKLDKNNAWFMGFFDADGSISLNLKTTQMYISMTNKLLIDMMEYKNMFGGNMYYDKSQNGYFKWQMSAKKDILNMYEMLKYSKSYKNKRMLLIKKFYILKNIYKQPLFKNAWLRFESQWKM